MQVVAASVYCFNMLENASFSIIVGEENRGYIMEENSFPNEFSS